MSLQGGRAGVKNTKVDRYGNYIGEGGQYELPTATATRLGGVKVGTNLSVTDDGTLSADEPDLATSNRPGIVKPGTGLEVENDGTINVQFPAPEYPVASKNQFGIVKIGDNIQVTDGVISVTFPAPPAPYVLPIASSDDLGGIKIGSGLSIDANGIVTVNFPTPPAPYVLPIAGADTLGGIKVGQNLTIDSDGTLNASGGGTPYVLPVADANTLGGVKIGQNLTIDSNGVLSAPSPYTLPIATASAIGGVRVGTGLGINSSNGNLYLAPYTYNYNFLLVTLNNSSCTVRDYYASSSYRTLQRSNFASYVGKYQPVKVEGTNSYTGKPMVAYGFVKSVSTSDMIVEVVEDGVKYEITLHGSLSSSTSFTQSTNVVGGCFEPVFNIADGNVTYNSDSDIDIADSSVLNELLKMKSPMPVNLTFKIGTLYYLMVNGFCSYADSNMAIIYGFVCNNKLSGTPYQVQKVISLTFDSNNGKVNIEIT